MASRTTLPAALLTVARAVTLEVLGATGANATAGSGGCACRNFAQVYYRNEAFCGRGNELYFLSKHGFSGAYAATEPIAGEPHRVCYDFFRNYKDAACVNIDLYPFPTDAPRSKNGVQWCYVDNDCDELNGGGWATNQQGFAHGAWHNLNSATARPWKICDESVDSMLKTKPVFEVLELGKISDVPLSTMLRLAYPAVTIGWGEASFFYKELNKAWSVGGTLADAVSKVAQPAGWGSEIEAVYSKLRDIATSNQATVLDSPGHGDNFHVVQGRAVWSVTRVSNAFMAYLSGHFSLEHDVECIMGCAQPESRDTVDMKTL